MTPTWLNPDCEAGKHTACAGDAVLALLGGGRS